MASKTNSRVSAGTCSCLHALRFVVSFVSSFLMVGVVGAAGGQSITTKGTFGSPIKMVSPRSLHTANLLINGQVLLAGGVGAGGESASTLASAEIFDPRKRSFTPTSPMSTPRLGAASVRLRDGRVFVAGGEDETKKSVSSVELYDPKRGLWRYTGSMFVDRVNPSATLLSNGKVLIVGGYQGDSACCALSSAEVYDPKKGTFYQTGSMRVARRNHTATLLNDGRVLVAGGYNGNYVDSPEVYHPETGTFSPVESMGTPRRYPSANRLLDGRVLIIGGASDETTVLASTNLFIPGADRFQAAGPILLARLRHTTTLLPDGKLLVAGGYLEQGVPTDSCESYDPITQKSSYTGSMVL